MSLPVVNAVKEGLRLDNSSPCADHAPHLLPGLGLAGDDRLILEFLLRELLADAVRLGLGRVPREGLAAVVARADGLPLVFSLLLELVAHLVPKLKQFVLHGDGLLDQRLHVLVRQNVRLFLEALLP